MPSCVVFRLRGCRGAISAAKWQDMVVAGTPANSVRVERAELKRLGWALLLSILAHAIIWGGYEGGKRAILWVELHHPDWIQKLQSLPLVSKPKEEIKKQEEPAPLPPLMFVDVNPTISTEEPPPNAKFESDKNSQAANPKVDKESEIPKIEGKQTDVVKTEDVMREKDIVKKLIPIVPAEVAPKEDPGERASRSLDPGETQAAKPDAVPRLDIGDAPKPRPRTLTEAMLRQPQPPQRMAGQAMKQDGGVKRHLEISALDVKATLMGAYEATLFAAIQQRWYDLLDERGWAAENRGKVVVKFKLHYDGTVTEVKADDNTTGAEVLGYVCLKSIQDPAPYAPWPSDMRHEIAKGVFEIQITFFYH